jgi:Bacterial membrane protein YfhO
VAPGPLNGIYLPLRAGGRCRGAWVRLSLVSGGRTLATSTRAAFDVGGGWTGFAILGRELAAGDRYELVPTSTKQECTLQVGMAGPRVARQLLIEDPGQSIRLASTEQAWIYQRPSAWELVSAHRRWRGFPDQESLLGWAATRPPEDADVAAYVGPDRPGSGAGGDPVVVSSKVVDNTARAVVAGDAESLLVVSQDLAEGWTARIDGEPADLVAVDGALQGVFVPPGRHTVVLSYMPRTFVLGSAVSAMALSALVLAWFVPWRRRRRLRLSRARS